MISVCFILKLYINTPSKLEMFSSFHIQGIFPMNGQVMMYEMCLVKNFFSFSDNLEFFYGELDFKASDNACQFFRL